MCEDRLKFVTELNYYKCSCDDALYRCNSDKLIDNLDSDGLFSNMRNTFHFDGVTAFELRLV